MEKLSWRDRARLAARVLAGVTVPVPPVADFHRLPDSEPASPRNHRPRFLSSVPALPAHEIGQPVVIPEEVGDMKEAYGLIPAVYAGVYAIAHSFASVPLIVYRKSADGPVPVPEHPVLNLLDSRFGAPNDEESAYDLWETHASYLELAGNAYWHLEGPGVLLGRPPTKITHIRPDKIRPVPGADGRTIIRYEYSIDGYVHTLQTPEVLHFRFFNPTHPIIGQSSVLPAKTSILLDYWANEFNKNFFRNGAKLGPVIRFDQDTAPELVKEAMKQFNDQHRGVMNAHKAKGLVASEIKFPESSHEDMGFYEGLKYTTSRVLMALGVPPVLVTLLDGSHYENTEAQIRIFFENTIMPKLRKRDALLNRSLMRRYGRDEYIGFDKSALTAMRQALKEIRETVRVYMQLEAMTPNEARLYLETGDLPPLPPLEGGDEVIEIGAGSMEEDPTGDPTDEEAAEKKAARVRFRRPRNRVVRRERDLEETMRFAEAAGARARVAERNAAGQRARARRTERVNANVSTLETVLRSHFSDQEQLLLSNVVSIVEGATSAPSASGSPERYRSALDDIDRLIRATREDNVVKVKRSYQRLISTFGKLAIKDLGAAAADVVFNLVSAEVVEYVSVHAVEKLTRLDKTTAETIKASYRHALVEAQLAGDNTIATATRIMEASIGDTYRSRRSNANRVARTETTAAYNFAEHEAWSQSEVVQTKIWHTQGDDRVRGEDEVDEFDHSSMEGVEVGIEQPFKVPTSSGGFEELMYPGDPDGSAANVIQCRCIVLPGVMRTSADPLSSCFEEIRRIREPIFSNGNGKGK